MQTTSRPDFAVEPGPGQESVWDYPRPPAIRHEPRFVEVLDGDSVVARSAHTYKVMETASPPTFYIPADDVNFEALVAVDASTYCEWKGTASYWALARDPEQPVGWSYENPRPRFDKIKGFLAFYPGRVDCRLGGEQAATQAGRFYGGWITNDVVGPFKGAPGTGHW